MRDYPAATVAALASGDVKLRRLVWIAAKNRDTGATETLGLWNGDQSEVVTINGTARTYIAGGSLLGIDDIDYRVGTEERMRGLRLSPINDAVELAIRGYEPRFAPIEVHEAVYNPATDRFVAEPHRIIRGWIDDLTINRAEVGGESSVEVRVATAMRAGSRHPGVKKSPEHQKRRGGDEFRRYSDISGSVEVNWG